MKSDDPLDGKASPLENRAHLEAELASSDQERLQILLYLIPVMGFFPALWTLYRQEGSRSQQNASRLAITLALGWILAYLLLGAGAERSDSLVLLVTAAFLTSGYFLTNLWLMVRVWQGKSVRLPGISAMGDRLP
jgi:hypothetical protein